MHRITPSSPDGPILRDIDSLAKEIGLGPGDYEPYGRLKAKLVHGLADKLADRPLAKYIGVTAINPTPLGEGKTVTAIGLAMALSQLGMSGYIHAGMVGHALGTNVKLDEGEFNFFRTRRDQGTKGAFQGRDAHHESDRESERESD